jgi:hypothetical protein
MPMIRAWPGKRPVIVDGHLSLFSQLSRNRDGTGADPSVGDQVRMNSSGRFQPIYGCQTPLDVYGMQPELQLLQSPGTPRYAGTLGAHDDCGK